MSHEPDWLLVYKVVRQTLILKLIRTGIIEGLPSGLSVSAAFINDDLRRRRTAVGRGERMGLEHDEVRITSGLFDGVTTGAPMTLHIKNADNSGKRDFDFDRRR